MLTPLEVTSSLSTCCGSETAIEKVIILHLHRRFSALNHSKSVYLYACVYVCIIEWVLVYVGCVLVCIQLADVLGGDGREQ